MAATFVCVHTTLSARLLLLVQLWHTMEPDEQTAQCLPQSAPTTTNSRTVWLWLSIQATVWCVVGSVVCDVWWVMCDVFCVVTGV